MVQVRLVGLVGVGQARDVLRVDRRVVLDVVVAVRAALVVAPVVDAEGGVSAARQVAAEGAVVCTCPGAVVRTASAPARGRLVGGEELVVLVPVDGDVVEVVVRRRAGRSVVGHLAEACRVFAALCVLVFRSCG